MTDISTGRPADPFTERTPRVLSACKLHRAAARRKQGRFLAEGANSVEAALATGVAVEVFVTEEARTRFAGLCREAVRRSVPISSVTERAARSLADTVTPTGLVAVCRPVVRRPPIGDLPPPRLVAVGQGLSEPGNVGTLIRVADALGVDQVWFTTGSADPENPKAVRASAGSLFHIPVICGVSEDELPSRIRAAGLQSLAATADGEIDVEHAEELLARPSAWIFGNEAHGIPQPIRDACDARVRIPIRGRAESLNIVTAASICLHTSTRLMARPR